jgi:hypothetical protein
MQSSRKTVLSRGVALGAPVIVVAALATPLTAYAAPADVVINELMYGPASEVDGDEFLELYNRGPDPVDLSGWSFSGITLTFPAGTTIAGNGFIVVAKDAARYQATYGGAAPNAIYTGSLSNGGETISLRDASTAVIDTVTYDDVAPWPGTSDEQGASLELIDPALDNNDYLNWAGSTAPSGSTPRAANSVRASGLKPRITGVSASPTSPAVNQPVTVTATVTGQTSASVRYRIDFQAEQTVAMTNAGGDTFTANIPGAAAGHLIRYRVSATNASGTSFVPRTDDTTVYQGVVVPSGISSPIRLFEWFIADADYNQITQNPTADIERKGAIAYNGTVIDNVTMNIRGAGSQTAPKPNWKFTLPHNYDIDFGLVEPVDEFGMQADWSDKSHGRPMLSWDAYKRAGVMSATSEQMFPMRTQRNAQFQGFYTYLDLFDGTWRSREGYSGDTQFFKAENGAFDAGRPLENVRFEKKNPNDEDFAPLRSFLSGIALTGNAQRDYLLGNLDIPQVINMLAVTAIVDHEDFSSKNFYFALRPATGRWSMIPWDLDHTLGNGCCQVNSTFVTPAEPGDKTNDLARAVLAVPQWREMYFRRLRTLVNDILAPGRMEALYDSYMGPAQPVTVLDFAAWPYNGTPTYANQRTALFNAIQARRNVFATDSRVPGNQPAAPNIVINEIQHSPTAGNGAEFIELANPNATAIDISGWTISDGITLTVQPGTVIPAGGRMTFVSNDVTFKSTYGSTVFVGGRFTGDLATSETLTLLRPDASVADTVTYGGAGWPVPSSGQSLELTNTAADNNDGANWALSANPGGSPGAANGGVVITEPAAPTIGTASPGNASATVTWTPPSNNGGSAITGYNVRVVNNTTNQQVGALRPAAADATSLTVTGLTNQTAYRLQVAAVNSVGQGPFSALSNIVTPTSGATPPGPPNIGSPSQGAVGGALTAICRWTPPASTGGSPITGYRVIALRMSSAAADAVVLSSQTSRVLGPGVRQYNFTLTEGNYRFQVVAINAAGTSPPSARSANVVPR